MPAFMHFGFFQFIFSNEWNPRDGQETYGALSFIIGTLLTSFLALIISIPFSLSLSLFNAELYKGKKIAYYTVFFTDLATGIPSIVLGVWAYYSLRPLLISLHIGHQGFGILTAAIVLSMMLVPYSSSICTSFISAVPQKLKESAYSLGATRFEVIRKISIPYAKDGIIAAFAFALARIMGETMIAAILIGNANHIPSSIMDTGNTMASIIINQFGSSDNLMLSSLFAVALILFILTAIVNITANYFSRRTRR
jgi:phosphate transport system permease protein